MNRPTFTVEEKLEVVEKMIEEFRWARTHPGIPDHYVRDALKAIARDLRARLPDAPLKLAGSLERRIASAHQQREYLGCIPPSAYAGIGQEVVGSWPVLRRALEAMEGG